MPQKQSERNALVDSKTTVLDLSDDCLISIFNYLKILDLVSVHAACKHFERSAEYCFQLNYKDIHIWTIENDLGEEYYVLEAKNHPLNYVNIFIDAEEPIVKMFKIFGKSIISLKLAKGTRCHGLSEFLYAANDYCGDNLKCVTLERMSMSQFIRIENLTNLGKRLECLRIISCLHYGISEDVDKLTQFLSLYTNLKQLTIIETTIHWPQSLLKGIHGNLEKLSLKSYGYSRIRSDEMCAFLRNHQRLKTLKGFGYLIPTTKVLKHLCKIEMISLDLTKLSQYELKEIDWIGLFQLKKLKRLELYSELETTIIDLNCAHSSSNKMSRPKTNIETLGMETEGIEQLFHLLTFFSYQRLKKLMVSFYVDCNFISISQCGAVTWKEIAKNCDNLEELYCFNVTPNSMNAVLKLVKSAKSLKSLHLYDCRIGAEEVLRLAGVQKEKKSVLILKHNCKETSLYKPKPTNLDVKSGILEVEYVKYISPRGFADSDFFEKI